MLVSSTHWIELNVPCVSTSIWSSRIDIGCPVPSASSGWIVSVIDVSEVRLQPNLRSVIPTHCSPWLPASKSFACLRAFSSDRSRIERVFKISFWIKLNALQNFLILLGLSQLIVYARGVEREHVIFEVDFVCDCFDRGGWCSCETESCDELLVKHFIVIICFLFGIISKQITRLLYAN